MREEAGPRETPVQDQNWWVWQEADLGLQEWREQADQEILCPRQLPAHGLAQVQQHTSRKPWSQQGEHEAGA